MSGDERQRRRRLGKADPGAADAEAQARSGQRGPGPLLPRERTGGGGGGGGGGFVRGGGSRIAWEFSLPLSPSLYLPGRI